ncbi:MAG: YHYH protein [Planctomycetales bacterium]|nr:YHYH protein [Planctomycetales bacterium]
MRILLLSCVSALCISFAAGAARGDSLISNTALLPDAKAQAPLAYELIGDCVYGNLSTDREHIGFGVRLSAGVDVNHDGKSAGELRTTLAQLRPDAGRWFRLQIRAMAQEGFSVAQEDLYLRVEFFANGGKAPLDQIKKTFFAQVEQERSDLKDKGIARSLGTATWRTYALDFRTPFPEVDALQLSAGFGHGAAQGKNAEFWIDQFELIPIAAPDDYRRRDAPQKLPVAAESLVPLGGRWHYDPQGGPRRAPQQFDHTNADQLLYLADGFIAPFAENTTSWRRRGYVGVDGKLVNKDEYVADNVVITITDDHLVIHSHNLPNHPTAVFPDRWRALDGNPNYIAEKETEWRIPLVPRENPERKAMQNGTNENGALPLGPIGVAVNGIVFFNPFDHLQTEDALWRLDRCCGHPAPNSLYHYHKYPVCIKSPWTDDGADHSPVIGFAFDGYPIYGPYEAAGELAKDSRTNPLNEFNVHKDDVRGWHYHVTPGAFPHIIGGFWGVAETRRGPPDGGDRPPGPPPRGRPPFGRPPFGRPPPR